MLTKAPSRSRTRLVALALAACSVLVACPDPVPTNPSVCKLGPRMGEVSTAHFFDTREQVFDFADVGDSPVQMKFTLTNFSAPTAGPHYFLSPHTYKLHDEWYWMRLLNGHSIDGYPVKPVTGLDFPTVDDVYAYIDAGNPFPLDLTLTGDGRLYSPLFYQAALEFGTYEGDDRFFGIGSVLFYPPNPKRLAHPDALWAFELEYWYEKVDAPKLARFFQELEGCLPSDVGPKLHWISRGTPEQDALAADLRAGGGPLSDRVLTYLNLAVDGEFGIYNAGIAAGKVKRYDGAVGGASVDAQTIVVANTVPDYLPPVAGIVTAVPQTPLAHLNLLAKARGTPNAYLGGVFDDARLRNWEKTSQPVILRAHAHEGVGYMALTNAQYSEYRKKLSGGDLTVTQTNLADKPYTVPLTSGGLAGMAGMVPLIGGKCAGFMGFTDFPQMETPFAPMCITIRAYKDHLQSFLPTIIALLQDQDFVKDQRARFVALEGEDDFRDEHTSDPAAIAWLDGWLPALPDVRQIKAVIAAGGLKQLLRDKPLSWPLKDLIDPALATRFGGLAVTQGLRFRSSSTAEDIPGFNGAGLYDSNTGFLKASELSGKDKTKTVDWALKKTWASYWSYEAFEERQLAGIEHLTGNMAVAVHPRFDDPLEQANGVITFSLHLRAGEGGSDSYEMVLNVQKGDVSVTNPDPANPTQPEIDHVVGTSTTPGTLARIQGSSLVEAGADVLTDAELLMIYDRVGELAQGWLANSNEQWPAAQRSSTLVLDLEFKRMAKAWPAWADGTPGAPQDRIIFKQARVLDNPIWMSEATVAKPIPRDLLSVAGRLVRKRCGGAALDFEAWELTTDPAKSQLLNYKAVRPFTAYIELSVKEPVPGLGIDVSALAPNHTEIQSVKHLDATEQSWRTRYSLPNWLAANWGIKSFEVAADGTYIFNDGSQTYEGSGLNCTWTPVEVGAAEYLEQIWQQP